MKDILINFDSPALGNNAIFGNDINNLHYPWQLLKTKLSGLGYDLKTADKNGLENCASVLFMDGDSLGEKKRPGRNLYRECLDHGLKDKIVLILWEGKSVKPDNYLKSLHDKFPVILTWNDELVDDRKFFKFFLPGASSIISSEIRSFDAKKLLVNISFNKNSKSKNELYSERRKSIGYFSSHYPNDFDLFGLRWNHPVTRLQRFLPWLVKKYITYRGQSKNKNETLSHYKFNICYENLSGTKGYITEKIFDSFHSGTVPIYWGASNIDLYVDTDTFIDRRKFNDNEELANYLIQMKEDEYNKYLLAATRYMRSEKYAKFLPNSFCEQIIGVLKLKQLI